MNKKGVALILGFFVIVVLAVLSASYLYKEVNQSFLFNRYIDSARALWLAEAGIQAVRNDNLDQSYVSGTLGGGSFGVNITNINSSQYYHVVSSGTFGSISRIIDAVVSTRNVTSTKFPYGVESSVDIEFKGSSVVYGENTTRPVPDKYRDPNYYKANATFSFVDLFGFSTTEIKGLSTIYNNTWPSGNFTGLNWVIAPSSKFNGDASGSGILIVQGNFKVNGHINFDGIIYVIGELEMMGTAYVNGAVLAESAASVDTTLTGTCDIEHNATTINTALDNVRYRSPQVVSWKEMQ